MSKKKLTIIITSSILAVALIVAIVMTSLYFATYKDLNKMMRIPVYEIPRENTAIVEKTKDYLGHPDLVRMDNGNILCVYPAGHGKGAIINKVSTDGGKTWDERLSDTPSSWELSQETPIVDRLDFNDGTHKYILTSGCPDWGDDKYFANGFNSSISDDGKSWTEFDNWYGTKWANDNGREPFDCIVAMASLTKLKDSNGNDIDKWMGIFHDHSYTNYKTFLTFEGGNAVWSEPEKLLAEHRDIEESAGLCEIECIRGIGDHSNTLALIARANAHKTNSMISISTDEGETWSKPRELAMEMSGERHKATYDPVTHKIVMSMRQLVPGKTHIFATRNFIGNQWVAWVGDFEDLLSFADDDTSNDTLGDAVLILGKCNNKAQADTGYSGNLVDENGNFLLASYGRFDKKAKNPYILSVRFNLKDVLDTINKK